MERNLLKQKMKTLLKFLMTAAAVVMILPLMRKSVYAASHEHGTSGEEGYLKFDKLITSESGILTTGNYYLENDVTLNDDLVIKSGNNVNICLNGHKLSYKMGFVVVPMIIINNNGDLTISSCTEGGSIVCDTTNDFASTLPISVVDNEGTAKLSGITVTETINSDSLTYAARCVNNEKTISIENCNLSLTNNHSRGSFGLFNTNYGVATLTNSTLTVSSNAYTGEEFIGIFNNQGTVNLSGNTITVNDVTGKPTGIKNGDAVTLDGDSISVTGEESVYGFWNCSDASNADLNSVTISTNDVGLACGEGTTTIGGNLNISGSKTDLLVDDGYPAAIASAGITSTNSIKVKISDNKTGLFAKPSTAGTSLSEFAKYFKTNTEAHRIITTTDGLEVDGRITDTSASGNTATVTVDTKGLSTSPTYQWYKNVKTDLSDYSGAAIFSSCGTISGNTITPDSDSVVALELPDAATAVSFSCTGKVYDMNSVQVSPVSGTTYIIDAGNVYDLYYGILVLATEDLTDVKIMEGEKVTSKTSNVISGVEEGDYNCTVTFSDGSSLTSDTVTLTESPSTPTSGNCGAPGQEDKVTWEVTDTDDDGKYDKLTISGTGEMANYTYVEPNKGAPWYDYQSNIKTIVIESGVKSIGNSAFYDVENIETITIPSSVETIGNNAFFSCGKLASVTFIGEVGEDGSGINQYAFNDCTNSNNKVALTVPSTWTTDLPDSSTGAWKGGKFKLSVSAYTVTFDMQGHGTEVESQTVDEGEKVSEPDVPVEEGYIFGGWYKDEECTKAWDFDNDTVTEDITLYAKWEEESETTYTVTFDANGHGTAPKSKTVNSGDKVTKPTNPVAEGYDFGGWYKEKACKTAWDFDNDTVTENITLYAKWTKESEPTPTPTPTPRPTVTITPDQMDYLLRVLGLTDDDEDSDDEESDSASSEGSSSGSSTNSSSSATAKDTYASELPAKYVTARDIKNSTLACDMKVHSVDAATDSNQEFLTNYFAGQLKKTPVIIATKNLDAYRALSLTENGSKDSLTWIGLDKKYAGPVYAVVYNTTDKAYMIQGSINENGTAVLNDFVLRPSSTVTLFTLK